MLLIGIWRGRVWKKTVVEEVYPWASTSLSSDELHGKERERGRGRLCSQSVRIKLFKKLFCCFSAYK